MKINCLSKTFRKPNLVLIYLHAWLYKTLLTLATNWNNTIPFSLCPTLHDYSPFHKPWNWPFVGYSLILLSTPLLMTGARESKSSSLRRVNFTACEKGSTVLIDTYNCTALHCTQPWLPLLLVKQTFPYTTTCMESLTCLKKSTNSLKAITAPTQSRAAWVRNP